MCAGVQVSVRASAHGAVLSAVRSAAGARTCSRGRRCKGATYGSVRERVPLLVLVLLPVLVLMLVLTLVLVLVLLLALVLLLVLVLSRVLVLTWGGA